MYKIYQVEYGDDLNKIASKVGSSIEELDNINGLNGRNIMVGELIIVPNNKSNNIFMKYKIKNGDTLSLIADTYGVSVDTLAALNGLNKANYIYPNQEIIIPKENVNIYVTKKGDTIETLLNTFDTTLEKLQDNNKNIYLQEDQIVILKKDNY